MLALGERAFDLFLCLPMVRAYNLCLFDFVLFCLDLCSILGWWRGVQVAVLRLSYKVGCFEVFIRK